MTGRPAATTLRAVTDLHVAVIEHTALRELAQTFPVIYQNLSAILAARTGSASFWARPPARRDRRPQGVTDRLRVDRG